jgi:outer membrane protein
VSFFIRFIVKVICNVGLVGLLMSSSMRAESADNIRDGAYFDIGIGLGVESDPFIFDGRNESGLDLYVNGRYQKYGFFVELPLGTSKQQATIVSLGYNFLNTEHWSYDLRLAMNHRDLDHVLPLSNRKSIRVSHSKLGLRVLGDFDNTHVKLIVAGASGDQDGGLYTSVWVSKDYQYYNWGFYGSFGIEYRNEDVVNYFYAINEVEGLPYYRGKSGFEYTAQVGVDYPIDENWVLEGFVRTTLLPAGISDSPLVDGNTIFESAVVIKYVF